jgi:dTDP-4-dehydrorhamnose reductase
MKAKNCLIFGGSGQIGRNLIRKLTSNNYKVTVVTRNIHQKSYIIKTQANAGYIDIAEANIFDEEKIRALFKKSDICINLIGILFEQKKGNTFKNIHSIFPSLLSKLCKEYNLKQFIHISALGINEAIESNYAKSKLEGENNILKNFPLSTILRPSIVYSVDDNFTTNFMTLLNRLPVFPIFYNGETKFSPIHCSDLTDTIYHIISKNIYQILLNVLVQKFLHLKIY